MAYFHDVARISTNRGLPTWSGYGGDRDTATVLPMWTWKRALNYARWLHGNFSMVRGALNEMCDYAMPLQPRYMGRDKRFKRAAEEWLWEWDKRSNLKGPMFNRATMSRIRLTERKVDGDIGVVLTRKPDGEAAVAHIRAHRIGSGDTPEGEITDGKYAGLVMCNGVIHDKTGRPVFYRVYTGADIQPDRYYDFSTRNMRLVYDPIYSDQQRGITHLFSSIGDLASIKQLREWEMFAQRKAAGYTFLEWNESGEAMPGAPFTALDATGSDTDETASGLVEEVYEEGLKQYFRAGSGSRLEAVQFDRPSRDAQAFEDKITTQAIYGIGWDPNFALAIKEPGGAWARAVIDKVRRHIERDQEIEMETLRWIHAYAVSVEVLRGGLPEPSDGDLFSWEYRRPARLTADSGNEARSRMDEYKLGLRTRDSITSYDGEWGDEVFEERRMEVDKLFSEAKKLAAKHEVSLDTALHYLEQRNPNLTDTSNTEPQPANADENQTQ